MDLSNKIAAELGISLQELEVLEKANAALFLDVVSPAAEAWTPEQNGAGRELRMAFVVFSHIMHATYRLCDAQDRPIGLVELVRNKDGPLIAWTTGPEYGSEPLAAHQLQEEEWTADAVLEMLRRLIHTYDTHRR